MRKFLFAILFVWLFAPAIAVECPAGYTPTKYIQLEYIESTGTQYIDTGYVPNYQGYIATGIMRFVGFQNNWSSVFGGYFDIVQNGSKFGMYNDTNQWTATFGRDLYSTNHFDIGKDYAFNVSFISGTKYVQIDNETVITSSDSSLISTSGPIYIFSYNRENLPYEYFKGRIYTIGFYDNPYNLVRDFIPVKRLSDNAIGMYDRVESKFYGNAGTGEFIAGPEILTKNTCFPCPPNTYKDFVGNDDCTPCPDTFSSPSGATSINECGRILHIGDYVAHMPVGRRTEHGLCTMFDGKKYCADVYERQ